METVILDEETIKNSGLFNYPERIKDIEQAYIAHSEKTTQSSKVVMTVGPKWKFNSLVCVGEKYVLNKWLGANVKNIEKNLPRSQSLVTLNDKETGLPLCIMNGTLISAVRTGAAAAVAAKHLARKDAEEAAVIGTGPIGQECVKCLSHLGLKRIRITSLDPELKQIAAHLDKELTAEIIPAESIEEACKGVPIVVSGTTAPKPIIKREWLTEGFTKISLAGREDEDGVVLAAHKIVADNWEHLKKRNNSTLALMCSEKKISDEAIHANIGDILTKKKIGRESDGENIYFAAVGLGELDYFVAIKIFESIKEHKKITL